MDALPHKISTLLYAFNQEGDVLLLRRRRPPNEGKWSPPGGKLVTGAGESPHACARREAWEEIGVRLAEGDLRLTGVVSERAFQGNGHWLMFLFEILPRIAVVPPPHEEGDFAFFPAEVLPSLDLPETDRERLWPWFWRHRGGLFVAHADCGAEGGAAWTLEESRPAASLGS